MKRQHWFGFLALSALFISFAHAAPNRGVFGLNDVSLLLPLPGADEDSLMIKPLDQGGKGVLIPKEIYQRFPPLESRFDAMDLFEHYFKVVAIRIDPCFTEGAMDALPKPTCRKQIRLVWQPILATSGVSQVVLGQDAGDSTTLDAALHSFYEFSDAEWATIMQKWSATAKGDQKLALQIHPDLKKEGYRGQAWSRIRKLILESCGDQNLVRVTGMRVAAARLWNFLGFDRVGDTWQKMNVPRTTGTMQTFFMLHEAMQNLNEYQGTITPFPKDEPSLLGLVTNSSDFQSHQSAADVKVLMTHAFQFENPSIHNPGTLDCVSCHLAQTMRLWGEDHYSLWDWKTEFASSRFSSHSNLENLSVNPYQTNRLRAFGYFERDPAISQRVINESAVVAKSLSETALKTANTKRK